MALDTNESDEKLTNVDSVNLSGILHTENIYKSECHSCHYDNSRIKRDMKRLIVISIICLTFMLAEVIGGILSNSLSIVSDAAHLASDFFAFMISLIAVWISTKPQNRKMNFGFHRAEVLGALISVMLIWLVTGILIYLAVERVISPDYKIDAVVMLYTSLAGIVANLVMGIVLIAYKKPSEISYEKKESLNMKSAIIHVMGDLLQSFGVFTASLIIYFKPDYKIADPICTFMFSIIVLGTTFKITLDIFCVLMEGFPMHLDFSEVQNVLFSIPGVVKIHNLRMWSLNLHKVVLLAHIIVRKGEDQGKVLKNASRTICNKFKIFETTLQIEELDAFVVACSDAV